MDIGFQALCYYDVFIMRTNKSIERTGLNNNSIEGLLANHGDFIKYIVDRNREFRDIADKKSAKFTYKLLRRIFKRELNHGLYLKKSPVSMSEQFEGIYYNSKKRRPISYIYIRNQDGSLDSITQEKLCLMVLGIFLNDLGVTASDLAYSYEYESSYAYYKNKTNHKTFTQNPGDSPDYGFETLIKELFNIFIYTLAYDESQNSSLFLLFDKERIEEYYKIEILQEIEGDAVFQYYSPYDFLLELQDSIAYSPHSLANNNQEELLIQAYKELADYTTKNLSLLKEGLMFTTSNSNVASIHKEQIASVIQFIEESLQDINKGLPFDDNSQKYIYSYMRIIEKNLEELLFLKSEIIINKEVH